MGDALDGAVIGVRVGTVHQTFVIDRQLNAELRLYDTRDQVNLDLVPGRIDAGLADITTWRDLNEAAGEPAVLVIGEPLTGVDFAIFGDDGDSAGSIGRLSPTGQKASV